MRLKTLSFALLFCAPVLGDCQTLTLDYAIRAAEANNRAILASHLEKKKALAELSVARTHRLPIFSFTALGSQPFSHLGLTLEKGSSDSGSSSLTRRTPMSTTPFLTIA